MNRLSNKDSPNNSSHITFFQSVQVDTVKYYVFLLQNLLEITFIHANLAPTSDHLMMFVNSPIFPNRTCVMEWEEPHDSTLYCIQTDGNYMIASGSSYYGVVRLWDKRQTACLQVHKVQIEINVNGMYFVNKYSFLCGTLLCSSFSWAQSQAPARCTV